MLVAPDGTTFNSSWTDLYPGQGCASGLGSGCCWAACDHVTCSGSGGSGGSNGGSAENCTTGGLRQNNATYAACLQMATIHNLTAGAEGTV